MTIAEQIYEAAKPLPEALAREALHYVEYLRMKVQERDEFTNVMQAQLTSMRHTWENEDDEVWNHVKSL